MELTPVIHLLYSSFVYPADCFYIGVEELCQHLEGLASLLVEIYSSFFVGQARPLLCQHHAESIAYLGLSLILTWGVFSDAYLPPSSNCLLDVYEVDCVSEGPFLSRGLLGVLS